MHTSVFMRLEPMAHTKGGDRGGTQHVRRSILIPQGVILKHNGMLPSGNDWQ